MNTLLQHKKYKACTEDTQNLIWDIIKLTTTTITIEKLLPYSEYLFKIAATVEKDIGDFTERIETTLPTGIFYYK